MGAGRDQAVALVKVQAGSEARPVLTDLEVGVLVDASALPDASGVLPSAEGWVETYDTNLATAAAWRAKAAKVAGDYSFSADGASYNKGDVLAHCLEMESVFAARSGNALGTIQVDGTVYPANTLDAIARCVIP